MSQATDSILHVMLTQAAPDGVWTAPVLRRLSGLSVGAFAGALSALRTQGKVHPFDLALSRAMWPVEAVAEDGPLPPSIAQQVDAEAREAVANRGAARSTGHGHYVRPAGPSAGAQFQEAALSGTPLMAAGILRDRWSATWDAVCRHAEAKGQKPVTAMIALLDKALQQETHA